jgi:alkanesulfonate monooxygenase SsuD/methylene tetrahydromethanopterin reductase-like flavin-dependent oxidoreductase (luciferase family)
MIIITLDFISVGVLDFGMVAGWYENEYKGYGFDFKAPKDRIGMLRECVEIVRSMWTEPETSYDGKYYKLDRAHCDPKPLQSPRPRILIGGGGEQLTLRVVARLADRSNFGGTPEQFAAKCEILKQHCKDVGRDYDEIEKTISGEMMIRGTDAELKAMGTRSLWGTPFDDWRASSLVGTPDEVAEKVQQYVDLGCTGFFPWTSDYPSTESIELFAQVAKQFR